MDENHAAELLGEIADDLETGSFIGRGHHYFDEISLLGARSLLDAHFYLPLDPFQGHAHEAGVDPDIYYTMFWRMFDKTPASMIQGFAIPLRRILAKRIFKHCGDGVIFHHNVLFNSGKNITLGDGVLVNRNSMLDDRGSIEVGAYTMLAAGITIETHTHPFDNFERPIAYAGRGFDPVKIGANSVLGYNTVVTAGRTIGYRCIVGANSVVTSDVPDYTVVGGVPARPIKQITPVDSDPVREALDSAGVWRDRNYPNDPG